MQLWQAYHFYDSLYSPLIFLSADPLTWLSDPCLFQVQKAAPLPPVEMAAEVISDATSSSSAPTNGPI